VLVDVEKRTGRNQRRLRNFLLNPRFQAKTIFWIVLSGLTMFVVCSSVFYVFVRENYQLLVDLAPMTDDVRAQLYRELHQILLLLGGFAVVFLAFMAMIGLVISHRTAGPLYRIKRVIEEVALGNPSARIHLRPNDDFQDVAESFNKMMDALLKNRSNT
jgi:HAMP domain-containing protein